MQFFAPNFAQTDGALAAVDCTKNTKLAQKYKIEGYPTRKYFAFKIKNLQIFADVISTCFIRI